VQLVSQENESLTAANRSSFDSALWYGAVTLPERIALLRASSHKTVVVEVDTDLSARRLQSWKSQPPFDKDTYFAQRLSSDEITEEDFRRVLGEPLEALRARSSEVPAWLTEIEKGFRARRIPAAQRFHLRHPSVRSSCRVSSPSSNRLSIWGVTGYVKALRIYR
jgi:hypothetical protein